MFSGDVRCVFRRHWSTLFCFTELIVGCFLTIDLFQEANTDAVISKRNFDEALRSTGPSVTDRERQKYERM